MIFPFMPSIGNSRVCIDDKKSVNTKKTFFPVPPIPALHPWTPYSAGNLPDIFAAILL